MDATVPRGTRGDQFTLSDDPRSCGVERSRNSSELLEASVTFLPSLAIAVTPAAFAPRVQVPSSA